MKENIFSPCDINVSLISGESTQKLDDIRLESQNGQLANLEIDTWYVYYNSKGQRICYVSARELDLDEQVRRPS